MNTPRAESTKNTNESTTESEKSTNEPPLTALRNIKPTLTIDNSTSVIEPNFIRIKYNTPNN